MSKTASKIAHLAAGSPKVGAKLIAANHCACCGGGEEFVPAYSVQTPTTSNHAELFRYGGAGVCVPCAWLFDAGKGRPGNYLACQDKIEYCVISQDSVVEGKSPWSKVLADFAKMSAKTEVAGVMTTDVKPRLFHKTRPATIGNFGLFVHAMDYDFSGFVNFNLTECLCAIGEINKCLFMGFSKKSIFHGLAVDFLRFSKDVERSLELERGIAKHRKSPHFLAALIAAGVKKEVTSEPITSPSGQFDGRAKIGGEVNQAQPGLF